jgi:hypothetical protein
MTVLADGGHDWYYADAGKPTVMVNGVTLVEEPDGTTHPPAPPVFVGGLAYSSLSLRPKASADITGGKVLHITGEWDAHNSDRRWQDVFIAPKGDAIAQSNWAEFIFNPMASKNCIAVSIDLDKVRVRQFDAINGPPGTPGNQGEILYERFTGESPSDNSLPCWRCNPVTASPSQTGHTSWANGLDNANDNRHRFDIFLSASRIKVYEEGLLRVDWTLPFPLSYSQFDMWFVQQLYHTSLEHWEIVNQYIETESLWRDRTPYTDQRHWDNLGFEVVTKMP